MSFRFIVNFLYITLSKKFFLRLGKEPFFCNKSRTQKKSVHHYASLLNKTIKKETL